MSFYFSIGVTFEILFLLLAAFSEIRKYVSSLAEAYVYSTVLILSIFSVSIQFFFLFGIHKFYPIIDGLLLTISIYLIFRNRHILIQSYASLKKFCMDNPFYSFSLAFFAGCLFAKGFLLPPITQDGLTYHLTRIMMMQSEGSFFLKNFSEYRQDIMPIGYDVLNFLYLRFFTDYGLTTFGFLSYTIILSGIFAVVTKLFSDVQFSKIICFMSASLTMFVFHASMTGNDLILAAIAIACFISAHNLLKESGYIHLFILLVALTFGLNAKFTFGVFFLPFVFFYGILLFNKFRVKLLLAFINKSNVRYIIPLILPFCTIFFICVLLFHNYSKYGAIMGPRFYLYSLSSTGAGFLGPLLNLIRYFFQAIDLPTALGGNMFTHFHDVILGKYKSTGVMWPEYYIVDLSGSLNRIDISAWYGLLGLPILISIGFTIICGKGLLRIIALSIFISAIILVIQIPWNPFSGRYFALTFAGGLVCFAFMLKYIKEKSFRVSKYIVICALLISTYNLSYLAFYANFKNFEELKHHFKNRDFMYSQFFPAGLLDLFEKKIAPGSKVLLFAGYDTAIFPLFLRRPDLNITVTGVPHYPYLYWIYTGDIYRETLKLNGKNYDLSKRADFKEVEKLYDIIIPLKVPQKYLKYFRSG